METRVRSRCMTSKRVRCGPPLDSGNSNGSCHHSLDRPRTDVATWTLAVLR